MKIVGIPGSTRGGSYNRIVLEEVLRGARAAGAATASVSLRDYPLPFYDGDLEAESGVPATAEQLRAVLEAHDTWVIATPEYNASIPAVLKNAIDWLSRATPERPGGASFKGRRALLVSAVGGRGGRGIGHLRSILTALGMEVLEDELVVPAAYEKIAVDGTFLEEALRSRAFELGASLQAPLESAA